MASVSATLSPRGRATDTATCATSRACVRRVRWWSSGNTKTWVLPASRRNDVACRMRSRSRSKHVRKGSGSSSTGRRPAPTDRVAKRERCASARFSRSWRGAIRASPVPAQESAWATVTDASAEVPDMVPAQRWARSAISGSTCCESCGVARSVTSPRLRRGCGSRLEVS